MSFWDMREAHSRNLLPGLYTGGSGVLAGGHTLGCGGGGMFGIFIYFKSLRFKARLGPCAPNLFMESPLAQWLDAEPSALFTKTSPFSPQATSDQSLGAFAANWSLISIVKYSPAWN